MPSAREFRAVADALLDALPADAVVVGIEVSANSEQVTLWTTTPGACIGGRGHMAETIRDAVTEVVGRPVCLKVELADGEIVGGPSGESVGIVTRQDLDPMPRPRVPRP